MEYHIEVQVRVFAWTTMPFYFLVRRLRKLSNYSEQCAQVSSLEFHIWQFFGSNLVWYWLFQRSSCIAACMSDSRRLNMTTLTLTSVHATWNGWPPNVFMGLRPTRWQSTWMEDMYWFWMLSTIMWVKRTYIKVILQACRIFEGLELHVLGGGPMT